MNENMIRLIKQKPKKERVTIFILKDLLSEVDKVAKYNKVSRSWTIEQILIEYIRRERE